MKQMSVELAHIKQAANMQVRRAAATARALGAGWRVHAARACISLSSHHSARARFPTTHTHPTTAAGGHQGPDRRGAAGPAPGQHGGGAGEAVGCEPPWGAERGLWIPSSGVAWQLSAAHAVPDLGRVPSHQNRGHGLPCLTHGGDPAPLAPAGRQEPGPGGQRQPALFGADGGVPRGGSRGVPGAGGGWGWGSWTAVVVDSCWTGWCVERHRAQSQ